MSVNNNKNMENQNEDSGTEAAVSPVLVAKAALDMIKEKAEARENNALSTDNEREEGSNVFYGDATYGSLKKSEDVENNSWHTPPVWEGVPDMPTMSLSDMELTALAGEPLKEGEKVASRKDILPFLEEVRDPEIGMSILDLGLLYTLDIDDKGNVEAKMGLTAAGCPFADVLLKETAEAIAFAKGTGEVIVKLVWEPAWDFSMMSDDAKLNFDLF